MFFCVLGSLQAQIAEYPVCGQSPLSAHLCSAWLRVWQFLKPLGSFVFSVLTLGAVRRTIVI